MSTQEPYNPLAKSNLGESVADALLRSPVRPLNETTRLVGAGVYAIYYTGAFPAYRRIRELNEGGRFEQPIYVGKAVPKGARKGGLSFDAGKGTALRDRLRQHATTIKETATLSIGDFHYRALTVDDIWIPLGENVLIEKFQPLWNRVIDGFGSKTPGVRRAGQLRSSWDTLHPGRRYVDRLSLGVHPLSPEQITAKIEAFFLGQLPEAEKLKPGEDEGTDEA
ncbi:MAG: Eco29kI family restriction endonuclease [Burkholderiales bacterium]